MRVSLFSVKFQAISLDPTEDAFLNTFRNIIKTAWKVTKYGVISGPYFPALGLNTL